MAVADDNVPLLGFNLALEDFYVDFDGMGVFCLDFSILSFILLVRFKILHFQEMELLPVHLAVASLIHPVCQPIILGLFHCTVNDAEVCCGKSLPS